MIFSIFLLKTLIVGTPAYSSFTNIKLNVKDLSFNFYLLNGAFIAQTCYSELKNIYIDELVFVIF